MNKALAVAVLLLGTLAIGFATNVSNAPAGTFAGPRVIAKVALTNQTANIPTTTILNVPATGVYRASAYMTQPTVGTIYGAWDLSLSWTDNSGPEAVGLLSTTQQPPPNDYATPGAVSVPFTFSAVAGTPVTYEVYGSDGGTYEVYVVIERLI